MSVPTDTELLNSMKKAMLALSRSQTYEIGGRRLTRANLPEVRDTIEWLERRINDDGDATGRLDLTSFRRP